MKRDVIKVIIKAMLYPYNRHFSTQLQQFVPKHKPVSESDVKRLQEFIFNSKKLLVLTGAGVSTESGKPIYNLPHKFSKVHSVKLWLVNFRYS